jgi:hypothetical protein
MTYKGYRILANAQVTRFFEIVEDDDEVAYPELGEQVHGIQYYDGNDEGEVWYSVVGDDDWVKMSFESVQECKEFIDKELAK